MEEYFFEDCMEVGRQDKHKSRQEKYKVSVEVRADKKSISCLWRYEQTRKV